MVMLYWQIGHRVRTEVLKSRRAAYGEEIVSTLSAQLGWSHFVEIIPLDDPLKRDFHAEMCRVERWSVRALRSKLHGMLFERTALSKKPAKLAQQELAVELLQLDKSGIRVATYLTELPPRDILLKKLHDAVRYAQSRLESGQKNEK